MEETIRHKKLRYNTEEERIEANRASKRKYQTKYRQKNPEFKSTWRLNNLEKVREYQNKYEANKRKLDPVYKLSRDIRNLIGGSFRRRDCIKPKKTEEILGCSITKFKEYILNLCPEEITLENFGMHGYHIDHIIPISTANSIEDVVKLCHYTNLQPLWCKDNLKKSNKIV